MDALEQDVGHRAVALVAAKRGRLHVRVLPFY
jgi:hypothetical protein